MRRHGSSVLANPVLVGAVTVLVTVVAVFLAYNANNGLPFVPTTELKVQLPNGANLVRGNEVRSGGYRVGVISDMRPVQLPGGEVGAQLTLELDRAVGDIPRDSRVVVRARSALGLKYLDLQEGSDRRTFADGDTIPVTQSRVPVDLDEVFNIFDRRTREASQTNLHGFGDALAGRGPSLGRTIEELPRVMRHLRPVMATLADPQTQLRSLFKEIGDTVRVLAPVSGAQARLFTTMADTWAAFGRDERALEDFIAKQPETLEVSTASLRVQRPFLTEMAGFGRDMQPAARALRAALPTVNRTLARGVGVQRRMAGANRRLAGALRALRELAEPAATTAAVRGLTATVATLNPQLRFYGPFQTVCNYWNYFWTQVAEHFSEPDVTGQAQRALINSVGRQDDSLGSMGANAPANGDEVEEGNAQHLHGPPYGAAIMPDGSADCEAGQRGYLHRQSRFAEPRFTIHTDPRSPGAQGPTFRGRARVPDGQTFTHRPETGLSSTLPAAESGDR